jgi:hypothetical protein
MEWIKVVPSVLPSFTLDERLVLLSLDVSTAVLTCFPWCVT